MSLTSWRRQCSNSLPEDIRFEDALACACSGLLQLRLFFSFYQGLKRRPNGNTIRTTI